jgi:zinc protease
VSSRNDPLTMEYGAEIRGVSLLKQSPPPGAASFSATYVGPAGWGFDPAGGAGTARAVNALLTSGAGRYDRVALARRLDQAGATLSTDCAPESAEATIWGPAENWADLLDLLADVVLRPRLAEDDLDRVRRQLAERQLRERTQPASRAARELLRSVYPEGHPYRSGGLGDARSISRLTPAKLRRFHREHYTGPEGALVVTAPAGLSVVEHAVRGSFAELPDRTAPVLRLPSVRSRPARALRVDLPGRSQVEIRIGGNSIARSDPVYPAAYLADEVLGGRAQLSRLFQQIRERGGMVYHASSRLEAMRFGGYWVVGAGTGAEHWKKVVPMLEKELDRMQRSAVPSTELNQIRESAIGEIPLSLESTSDAHELAVDVAYHRLPGDYWARWKTSLRRIRPREVREAVEQAMDRRRAVTVLAGPLS